MQAMTAINITFRQIEAFRALMQRHTVTRAAKMLRISQPAMSRLIGDFESATGLMLFDRRQGRLLPTREAAGLFEEVEQSFRGLDRIAGAVDQIRDLRRGSLHIACSPALALRFLPQLVAAFMDAHAGIEVTMLEHAASTVIDDVAGQRADVGFLQDAITHPAVQLECIFEAPMVCILPPGHRLADRQAIGPKDLASEVFISFPPQCDAQIAIDNVFAAHGITCHNKLYVRLSQTAMGLVECGAGVAIIDLASVLYARGRLAVRPFQPAIPDPIFLATTVGCPLSALATGFVRMVRESLARGFLN